jgi:hypothetical protein
LDRGVEYGCHKPRPRGLRVQTDHPSKIHKLSEQGFDLLAELLAISAEYSDTRDFNGALTAFNPVTAITGGK